jgi:hypothetical protein
MATYSEIAISNLTPGDDWYLPIPVDGFVPAVGDTARCQVRSRPESATVALEMSTANGRIQLSEEQIALGAPSGVTVDIAPGAYVWDLEIVRNGVVSTILGGTMTVRRDITRGPIPSTPGAAFDFTLAANSALITLI